MLFLTEVCNLRSTLGQTSSNQITLRCFLYTQPTISYTVEIPKTAMLSQINGKQVCGGLAECFCQIHFNYVNLCLRCRRTGIEVRRQVDLHSSRSGFLPSPIPYQFIDCIASFWTFYFEGKFGFLPIYTFNFKTKRAKRWIFPIEVQLLIFSRVNCKSISRSLDLIEIGESQRRIFISQ